MSWGRAEVPQAQLWLPGRAGPWTWAGMAHPCFSRGSVVE